MGERITPKLLRDVGDDARFQIDDYDLRLVEQGAWPHVMSRAAAVLDEVADEMDVLVDRNVLDRAHARTEEMRMERDRLRRAVGNRDATLAAVRASYAEFQTTHDLHELARAVGNILKATGGTHG